MLLLLGMGFSMPVASAVERSEDELLLKAAFIHNFAKLTRWPERVMATTTSPFSLCTLGQDALVDTLKKLRNRSIKGRSVILRSFHGSLDSERCHLLYIAASESGRYGDITTPLRQEPVLTVSEHDPVGHKGGMIQLYLEQGKIRFAINPSSAQRAGLEFSSHLLRMAGDIHQGDDL